MDKTGVAERIAAAGHTLASSRQAVKAAEVAAVCTRAPLTTRTKTQHERILAPGRIRRNSFQAAAWLEKSAAHPDWSSPVMTPPTASTPSALEQSFPVASHRLDPEWSLLVA